MKAMREEGQADPSRWRRQRGLDNAGTAGDPRDHGVQNDADEMAVSQAAAMPACRVYR